MGFQNGRLPDSALAPIPGGRLRKDAAAAWNAMLAEARRRGLPVPEPDGADSTYRPYDRQVFWRRWWCGQGACANAALPGTSRHGLGIAVDCAEDATHHAATIDQIGEKYGWSKKWSDACVPLATRILTRRGLVTVDDLVAGDETVGYNQATGETEWTPILDVHRFENAEVLRYEHSTVALDCTANHKWLTLPRPAHTGPGESARLAPIDEIRQHDRIILAASGAEGEGLPITDEEAALIGWALTDGSIYRFDTAGRGPRAFARIYQTKAVGVAAVDDLMTHFDHERQDEYETGEHVTTMWYVGRSAFSPILHRSRLDELGVVRFVLALTTSQRQAFLAAVQMAEGEQAIAGKRIAQAAGDRREAFAIASALEGHLVALRPKTVNLKRPAIRRYDLLRSVLPNQSVWCPTTGLGSWLAEQGGQIFLTGNSWEPWHNTYKVGIWKQIVYRWLPLFWRNPRNQGGYVMILTGRLKNCGYLSSRTSRYSPQVRDAVLRFQRNHHLRVDGIVGPFTWEAIKAAEADCKRRHRKEVI